MGNSSSKTPYHITKASDFNEDEYHKSMEGEPFSTTLKFIPEKIVSPLICNFLNKANDPEFKPKLLTWYLENYSQITHVDTTNKSNIQIAQEITAKIPCDWINSVNNWLNNNKNDHITLRLYTSEYMVELLEKNRNNSLNSTEKNLISDINKTIYKSPLPLTKFVVARGQYSDIYLKNKNILRFDTPKSGSFDTTLITTIYVGDTLYHAGENKCCFIEIMIPRHSILTFYNNVNTGSEQVIFPIGAEFYIISKDIGPYKLPNPYHTSINGKPISITRTEEERKIITYKLVYIDAPQYPVNYGSLPPENSLIDGHQIIPNNYYSYLKLGDLYEIMYYRNIPFPYTKNPFQIAQDYDKIDNFIEYIKNGEVDLTNVSIIKLYLIIRGENYNIINEMNDEEIMEYLTTLK